MLTEDETIPNFATNILERLYKAVDCRRFYDLIYFKLYYINITLHKRKYYNIYVRRRGVIGRVPAFKPGGSCSFPGEVRNCNYYPGPGYVSFIYVLSCVDFGGGPGILLRTDFREASPCVSV